MSYEGVENTGGGIQTILEGFGSFTLLGSQYLADEGIGTVNDDGIINIDPHGWYPFDRFIRAFNRIGKEVGAQVLFNAGTTVPKYAQLPPTIKDIESALMSLDVAYHMSHRLKGEPMFNVKTGEMKEGIGHYAAKPDGERRFKLVCDNPYPCDLDRGIVAGMAYRFEPKANVTHVPGSCRNKGGTSCTYVVTW